MRTDVVQLVAERFGPYNNDCREMRHTFDMAACDFDCVVEVFRKRIDVKVDGTAEQPGRAGRNRNCLACGWQLSPLDV